MSYLNLAMKLVVQEKQKKTKTEFTPLEQNILHHH